MKKLRTEKITPYYTLITVITGLLIVCIIYPMIFFVILGVILWLALPELFVKFWNMLSTEDDYYE